MSEIKQISGRVVNIVINGTKFSCRCLSGSFFPKITSGYFRKVNTQTSHKQKNRTRSRNVVPTNSL
jgi:hypothetical protein